MRQCLASSGSNSVMATQRSISIIDIAQLHGQREQAIHQIIQLLGSNVEKVVGENTKGQSFPHRRFGL